MRDGAEAPGAGERRPLPLDSPDLYLNRELSWLQFNSRVLEEAFDQRHPLLERVKFLAIFDNNLDEFFMIRVSGLRKLLGADRSEMSPDGLTPAEQLGAIRREVVKLLDRRDACWNLDLLPKLGEEGIHIREYGQLSDKQKKRLRKYFKKEVFATLTPLAIDPSHPFPHISNLSVNLAVVVQNPEYGERMARLKVPASFPRLIRVPQKGLTEEEEALGLLDADEQEFVWQEQVLAANLDRLFPGHEVIGAYPFRVTRDADLEIQEDEAADLLETIEESIEMRQFGSGIRLEVDTTIPDRVRETLARNLGIPPYLCYTIDTPLGLCELMELTKLDRPDLKSQPFPSVIPPDLVTEESLFPILRQKDHLLYHPYDSFTPVIDFIREAARDPAVLAIKQTLYRLGANSPIVDALLEARRQDKQVAVLVELKARFDEESNIAWARALEQAGVHVVYGLLGLKTHCKVTLVVRREPAGIVRYIHMSTGNYNAITARQYTDIGFLTRDPEIGTDATMLFNALTGYSKHEEYHKLLVAPQSMREEIIRRIEREAERHLQHHDGYIAFKMNSLVDKACIRALYSASQAGVPIDLQVRGVCCLRPGIAGLSETITVTSVVGRFLEHPRIFYFRNGGDEEVFIGSADLMPRNLDRRVEVLFPIENPELKRALVDEILKTHLKDSANARRLDPDGNYERVQPLSGEQPFDSQQWMIDTRLHG